MRSNLIERLRCLCVATAPSYLSPLFVASLLETAGDDATATKYAWAQAFVVLASVAIVVAATYAALVVVEVVDEDDSAAKKKKDS